MVKASPKKKKSKPQVEANRTANKAAEASPTNHRPLVIQAYFPTLLNIHELCHTATACSLEHMELSIFKSQIFSSDIHKTHSFSYNPKLLKQIMMQRSAISLDFTSAFLTSISTTKIYKTTIKNT
jgi:hypothetical protein